MSETAIPRPTQVLDIDRSADQQQSAPPQPAHQAEPRPLWSWLTGAVCIAGAVWLALPASPSAGASPQQTVAPHVRAVSAKRVQGVRAHSYSGTVRAENQSVLSFLGGGRLLLRKVDAGDVVQAGQLLARSDADPIRNAHRSLSAQLQSLMTQRDQLSRDVERIDRLHAQGAASSQQREQLTAQQHVIVSNIAALQAQQSDQQRQISEATMLAPFAGVVTEVLAEEGEVLAPGQPVLRIAAPGGTEVEVRVPESLVASLRSDMPVTVRFPMTELPAQTGTIAAIGRSAVAGHALFPVRVRLNDASQVRAGMTAEVTFRIEDGERVLLPADAIAAPTGERTWVLTIDAEQRVRNVTVRVEGASDDGIIVQAPLRDGELVVVGAPAGLIAGTRVTVSP